MSTTYISNVKLSGYKSIEDVSIDFSPHLSIIIGKNAAGKTNFINFLNDSLNFKFGGYNNFNSVFTLTNDKDYYEFSFNKKTILNFIDTSSDTMKFKKISNDFKGNLFIKRNDSTEASYGITSPEEVRKYKEILENDNLIISSRLIKHGLPKLYPIIDAPLNLEILIKGSLSDDFFEIYGNSNNGVFFKKILASIIHTELILGKYFNGRLKKQESIDKHINKAKLNFKKSVLSNLKFLENFKKVLLNYSPIENVRLNENFLIEIDNLEKNISIKNFYLEFLVDKKWYTFDDLSDGTRRIFYILSELFTIDLISENEERTRANFVLIEEPELGIHPHQLLMLMHYIKEKSKFIQILLTTHSPLTLDILHKDELNSIIIASKIDGKTSLKKLDDVKLEKASMYMDEIDLSDYWVNSDLED